MKKVSIVSRFKIIFKLYLRKLKILDLIYSLSFWKEKHKAVKDSFIENAPNVLALVVKEISLKNKEPIWPTFGTLLGLARDKKIISYDRDLDFGYFYSLGSQHRICEKFINLGFTHNMRCYVDDIVVLDKFTFNNVETDIYYFFDEKENYVSYDFEQDGILSVEDNITLGKKIHPYKSVYSKFELKLYSIDKLNFLVPQPIENHLIELYGPNYKIPDKNWHDNKRIKRFKVKNAKSKFVYI